MPASARGASSSASAPGRSSMSATITSCSPRTTKPARAAAWRATSASSTSRWMIPSGPNCWPEQPWRLTPAWLSAPVSWANVPAWYGRMNIRSFIAPLPPSGDQYVYSGPGSGGLSSSAQHRAWRGGRQDPERAFPVMSYPSSTLLHAMRHTTFRFALAPTPAQAAMLARHAGASRFAYNQCLRLVADARAAKRAEPQVKVPWSGFDLINALNAWKRSEAAGRVFVAAPHGTITKQVTGLGWRHEVSAQVFEEAAVDLGRALSAFGQAKSGNRKGRRAGFPRWKRKGRCRDSFRLRNKHSKGGRLLIRVGDGHPRSVTLPTIGTVRVHDDTRRLRRLLRPVADLDPDPGPLAEAPRARILSATVSRHGSRWYVSLNVQAPDVHARRRHLTRPAGDDGGFVGVDRGLAAFAVAATADG